MWRYWWLWEVRRPGVTVSCRLQASLIKQILMSAGLPGKTQVKGCPQGIHLNRLLTVVGFKEKKKVHCYPLDYFTTPPPAGRIHHVHWWLFIHVSTSSDLCDENISKRPTGRIISKVKTSNPKSAWKLICSFGRGEVWWKCLMSFNRRPFKMSYPRAHFRIVWSFKVKINSEQHG